MNKFKKNKGITLVALIITIIVLLILAVVSIRAVTGDGIIQYAKNARSEYGKAQTNEKDMLSKYEYEIAKAQGTVTGSYKDYLLQKEYEEKKNAGNYEGTYTEYVSSKYGLGTAANTENYGKKVVGYKSKGEGLDTLVWRLFYQDDKNVYLISETSDGQLPVEKILFYIIGDYNDYNTYKRADILKKYKSGADVSVYGQALMPKASSLFTESNKNENIIATAYLCDTEVWDAYTDAEGKASYAMGSPTIELFAESYNASNLGNTITLGTNTYGYTENTSSNWFTTSQKNGIYNLTGSSYWWLASPSSYSASEFCSVAEDRFRAGNLEFSDGYVQPANGARPVVCIPLSEFNYTFTD